MVVSTGQDDEMGTVILCAPDDVTMFDIAVFVDATISALESRRF